MRAMLSVPVGEQRKLPAECLPAKWHEDETLANRAEAGRDAFAITPGLEHVTPAPLALGRR